MFRLTARGLPKEPRYGETLEQTGYFINDDGLLRNVDFPQDPYRYSANKNERHNIVLHEAVFSHVRAEVVNRLGALGIRPVFLPQLTNDMPDGASLPILTTAREQLCRKEKDLIICASDTDDLGITSLRTISAEGVEKGSIISTVKELIARANANGRDDTELPGIVVTNPGQLLYSHKQKSSLSILSWNAQQRPSGLHVAPRIHDSFNKIEGNRSPMDHLGFVFKEIVSNPAFVSESADLILICNGGGGRDMVELLDSNWARWSSRIFAIAFVSPPPMLIATPELKSFLAQRGRGWVASHHVIGTVLSNANNRSPFPLLSGGDFQDKDLFPFAQSDILDWIEEVAAGDAKAEHRSRYGNGILKVGETVLEEMAEAAQPETTAAWGEDHDADASVE